jgi:hypothetical protein
MTSDLTLLYVRHNTTKQYCTTSFYISQTENILTYFICETTPEKARVEVHPSSKYTRKYISPVVIFTFSSGKSYFFSFPYCHSYLDAFF